jgi:large subunit ribosomal protein L22
MEVIAKARNIRMSPRKVRLVIDLVRGMAVDKATAQLRFFRKDAARPVLKLIESAVANAKHNFKLESSGLFIKKIVADGGPVLDRWRARAFGRAAPIRKRSCHITVVLDEKKAAAPKGAAAAVVKTASKTPAAEKGDRPVIKEAKPAAKKVAKSKSKE